MAASGRSATMSQGRSHEKVGANSTDNKRGGNMFANPAGFNMPSDSANIVLTTSGSRINVNIGSIKGNVSVGAKNTITTYRDPNYDSSDSSSSWSDSSSDSDSGKRHRKHLKHKQLANRPAPSGSTDKTKRSTASSPRGHTIAGQQVGQSAGYPVQDSQADTTSKLKSAELKVKQALEALPAGYVVVSSQVLVKISGEFELGWRRVFRFLGLSDALIDETHLQFHVDGLKEVVLQLLQIWNQQENGVPDGRRLAEALVRADQMHAFNVLREAIK